MVNSLLFRQRSLGLIETVKAGAPLGAFPRCATGEPQAGLLNKQRDTTGKEKKMNTATLAENIANDLEQGLPKELVIRYWQAKAGDSNEGDSISRERRPRAIRSSLSDSEKHAKAIDRIRRAGNDRIITLLEKASETYSYNSIARAIYGVDSSKGHGYKVRKWATGITSPHQMGIEKVRSFLIDVAEGRHQNILKAPGGNRK